MKLIIGSKRYSTWSMRPWVFMRHHGIRFEEELIPFEVTPGTRVHTVETDRLMNAASPNGRVPVLVCDGQRINESLAICEFLSEYCLEGAGWPCGVLERAKARAISLEMATGFTNLRRYLPMSIGSIAPEPTDAKSRAWEDIQRVLEIVTEARETHDAKGKFLFGGFSIADAMFAPVMMRFETYQVDLPPCVAKYSETIRSMAPVENWCAQANQEAAEIQAISEIVAAYPREIAAACKI